MTGSRTQPKGQHVIVITGGGDDIIEVAGDLDEEFTYQDEAEGDLIAFSDGTLIRVRFDNEGSWRITPIAYGKATLTIEQTVGDGGTDRAVLVGAVNWVIQATAYHRVKTN